MHTLKISDRLIQYPSKWDELSLKQLFYVIDQFNNSAHKIDFLLKTALKFTSVKLIARNPAIRKDEILHPVKLKKLPVLWLSNVAINELGNSLSFLIKEITDKKGKQLIILNSGLTVNLIPRFRYRFHYYYGPEEKLFNITFDEFLEAEIHSSAFERTGLIKHLDKLVATLYRRQDKNYNPDDADYTGDRRQPFNQYLVEKNAAKFKRLNFTRKLAVFMFFKGVNAFLERMFPLVFSSSGSGKKNKYGPLALVDVLSGDDVTKNNAVRKTLLYEVMVRLQRSAEQYEEMKKQMKDKK